MRASAAVVLATLATAGCGRPTLSPPPPEPIRSDRLAEPVRLERDGQPIDSGYPFLGDLDGDGRPELLMGGEPNGRLLVYRNVGTPTAPRLDPPTWFDEEAPGGRVPRGCAAAYFGPQLVDFDGDGRPDLLSGSHCCDSFGFHVFRRTADGWAPRRHLTVAQGSKHAGVEFTSRSTVTAADWNGDGIPDLLWRNGRGIGVALGPFPDDKPLDVAHEIEFTPRPTTVDEAVYSPTVADWDADGKPDLLVGLQLDGGRGGIYWFRNLGGPGLTQLAPGELLLGDAELNGPTPKARHFRGYAVGDWDGDGRPDLIVTRDDLTPPAADGKWVGSVWLYRRE